jgi:hypothetical protein
VQRIAVVGTTAAGKSTLARSLAAALGLPHIELDALHWGPGWVAAEPEEFQARVRRALDAQGWVADGNYAAVRELIWQHADTLLWLDYPLRIVLGRAVRRTLHRILSRRALWSGNRETLRAGLFGAEAVPLWVMRTFHHRRRQYAALIAQPQHAHLAVQRFLHPLQAQAWLEQTCPPRPPPVAP